MSLAGAFFHYVSCCWKKTAICSFFYKLLKHIAQAVLWMDTWKRITWCLLAVISLMHLMQCSSLLSHWKILSNICFLYRALHLVGVICNMLHPKLLERSLKAEIIDLSSFLMFPVDPVLWMSWAWMSWLLFCSQVELEKSIPQDFWKDMRKYSMPFLV